MHSFSDLSLNLPQVFEALPDCYLVLSPDFVILAVTDSYLKSTFTSREKLVGNYLFEVFTGQNGQPEAKTLRHLKQSLQKVLQTKKPDRMPIQHFDLTVPERPNLKQERYWKPVNTPVLDDKGEVLYILHKVEDVTKFIWQSHKLESLAKQEEASKALLQEAEAIGQTGSYEIDLTTLKFRLSKNMYHLLRLKPQSLGLDLDFIDSISHPEDAARVREIMDQAIEFKKTFQYTRRIYRPDGEMRYIFSKGKVVSDEAGKAIKIVGTAQDITEKKRAEEEIKKNKDLLEAVFHASLNGIEVYQTVRNAAGEIIDFEWLLVNHTTERYAGRTDLIGHNWVATYPEVKQNGMFDQFRKVVETRQNLNYEHFEQYKNFAAWFETMAVPFGDGLIVTWTDITNRKKAEAELTGKAELLQTIVDTAFGGMALLAAIRDEEGKITDFRYLMVNSVQARYANISKEKMVGNTVLAFFPSIKSTRVWECLLRVMETGETMQRIEEYHDDGVDGWFEQHYEKMNSGILVWNVDITPIKRAEMERTESEERFRKFIDSLPQMAWTASVDGGSTYYNQKTYDYTGLTFEQIKAYGWEQTYMEAERAQIEQEWRKAIASGKEYRKQSRMRRWDGAYRWQLVIAQPVRDHTGNIISWAGTVTDIHEKVIAEKKLQKNRQLLKAVLNASINGIQAFRAIRDEENQLIDFVWILTNRVTDNFLQRKDLRGKRLKEEYPGTVLAEIFDKMKQVNESGQTIQFEVWYPYEGFHHWFQFIVVKLGDGVVLTFQDITERKKLEEQRLQWELQKQQELMHAILEAEEREKKRIAESLHNGLGQVLFAAKLQLNLLNPEESFTSAAQTMAFWQRTDELLTNAIDLTRNISHELTPTVLENFGLSAVLVDICKQLSSKNLQIDCQITVKSILEKHLQAAIYRIVQELTKNIVKHAHATSASIKVWEEDTSILISALDNGKGFKAKPLPIKGMGLLSIGDRVKLLNGTLQIQSSGQGTTITVKLPRISNHAGKVH